MTFITGLIIGLIVGWIIEWVIDWLFWRRDDEQIRQQLAVCQERIKTLEAELAAKPQTVPVKEDPLEEIEGIGPIFAKRLKAAGIYTFQMLAQTKPNSIREIISPEEWQKVKPESWVAEARQLVGLPIDPLEKINGIGPVFAKRLNGEGIYTFNDLATLAPQYLEEILKTEEWQKIEPEKWIAEARDLAQQKGGGA